MNSIVIITESKDSHSTKLLNLNSKLCWPNMLLTYHSDINMMKNSRQSIMSLNLLTASPQFTGPWNENASSPHGKHLQNTPFHIFHLFLNVKINLPHLNFEFTTPIAFPLKYVKMVVKCETELRSAHPHFPWNLDTDLSSNLCWPYIPGLTVGGRFRGLGNSNTREFVCRILCP